MCNNNTMCAPKKDVKHLILDGMLELGHFQLSTPSPPILLIPKKTTECDFHESMLNQGHYMYYTRKINIRCRNDLLQY